MPVHKSKDSNGHFYRWGEHGHKYYFDANYALDMLNAYLKAAKQGRAIKVSQYRTRK